MNIIQQQDIEAFVQSFTLKDELKNCKFLITGATGLIGSSLVHCLLAIDRNVHIVAPVRNREKAEQLFKDNLGQLELIECPLTTYNENIIGKVDYIVHCAAPTASRFFVEKPVETFDFILNSSQALLEYARKNPVKGFVYLSSLEVYGEILDDSEMINEQVQGYLDPMSVRSSYPMAKRSVENLCCLYAAEYGVPAKVARLTQTTGAGISRDDNRVIAQFARLAAQGQDIVLHTTGESARPYCYLMDCISAILFILLKGNPGESYNVANEETYISARGMAEYLKQHFNPSIQIRVELNGSMGYAPATKQRLSSQKLRNLGWEPEYPLHRIFERLIAYLKS
ncbi:MAG: NAD(P)-dependent oxidoreductase [Bacteroidaceae bacterium]|nr:NAD(P)-dependent oxidoreductase [Bacteroidaceae bacterium]